MPGMRNILVSRQDSGWRGAESPVPPAEDVLHSMCMPGASKPPCTLSSVCAFPFADFCLLLLSVLFLGACDASSLRLLLPITD